MGRRRCGIGRAAHESIDKVQLADEARVLVLFKITSVAGALTSKLGPCAGGNLANLDWQQPAAGTFCCILFVISFEICMHVRGQLGRTAVERALLLGSCLLVLIVELLNTALENVVDRIGQEPHRLSGQAKDLGSAAVFVSLVLTAVVWSLIAWARFAPSA